MIEDSPIESNQKNDDNINQNSYSDYVSEILSIELPKTKVIVRKRPLNSKEILSKEVDNISIIGDNKVVLSELKKNLDLTKYIEKKEFIFDRAYNEKATNDAIYKKDIRPMIYNALYQKAKITCFAYGQTGSGKTYTLFGNTFSQSTNKNITFGLYALAGYDVFQIVKNDPKFQNFSIFVSFYEIYCDKLFDLLNNRNRLETREDYKHDINIIGLSENKTNSLEELMRIVDIGSKQRTIGKTGANSESSRSHGIIQLRIFDNDAKSEHAKISFIDLAGSERESDKVNVDKKTRIDGAAINQSLLALKECIRALEQDQIHLPFRGNKLTLVLRDSFIGNCKTLMISTISPGYKTSEHSLNTLRYAYRLKEIKNIGNGAKNLKSSNSNNNRNNKITSKNNEIKTDPNQFIGNLLNDSNMNFASKKFNMNNNTKKDLLSDSKNNRLENDIINKLNMNLKPKKRKNSFSSNASMKDVNRDNSNESKNKKKRKDIKVKNPIKNNKSNNIKAISNLLKIEKKEEPKNTNSNNICTLTLMTSNNNNLNPFSKNNQMNITQQINLHNTNLQTNENQNSNTNNNNFSFNLFNDNNNFLNLSNSSIISYQSKNFNDLSLTELEKKNEKMVEDIVKQDKLVKSQQQNHINTMCELITTEINTFQQYQQEQIDISTYIEAMQNILKSEDNQFNQFNIQLEKLNYMIKQQIKISNLIEQMKHNETSKLSISSNLGNNSSLIMSQNAMNLKNLQNIQKQINNIGGDNIFQ